MATARVTAQSVSVGPGVSTSDMLSDPESPFLDTNTPMTSYEWAKILLFLPVILIRTLLTAIILPLVWLYLAMLTQNLPINNPLPRWRALFLLPVLRFWGQALLLLGFFLWPSVKGKHYIKEAKRRRAIMIFNHVSYLDALIIGSLFSPCGLAKAGVADIPFFGSVARAFQFVFVQRAGTSDPAVDGSPSRVSSTQAMQLRAADSRYSIFAIGPEGTTKHSQYLLQFSTGAFVGGRPVIPVLLKYKCRHFDVGWGVIQSVYWHFLRIQSQFANICEIEVLPVYEPSEAEKADPRVYADNVRRLMAEKLGAKLSPYGVREQQLLKKEGYCVHWTGGKIVHKQPDSSYVDVPAWKKQ